MTKYDTVYVFCQLVITIPDSGHTLNVSNYMLGSMKLMSRFSLHVEL